MPRWQPRHTMYLAASLSAWGDRMWTFAVGLYMVYATPDSLRLTAIYGLVISVSVIALGATVGRWVDTTGRLRAAQLSLVVQNSAVCCCAILLMVGLQYADYTASTWNGWLHILIQVLVILIADVAALATVANKITIEKDWVVVMAHGDEDKLAWMNSAFRTIDLGTYILAPVLVGQLMTFLSPVAAAAFMAGWNVVSLAVEYYLLRRVYSSVPQLARPKVPDTSEQQTLQPGELQTLQSGELQTLKTMELRTREGPADGPATEAEGADDAVAGRKNGPPPKVQQAASRATGRAGGGPADVAVAPPAGCCGWLGRRLADTRRGWIIYFRSSFCLAGLALASLYMTVLGFDNITAGYGYTQGLTESTLSLLTGAGAFAGICGSLCFPRLRHSIGPTRAGVLGFSLAVLAQTLSLASVFLPGTAFWPLAEPDGPQSRVSVITLFCGIILARFGLWVSDLSVTQLLQERVPESRRGAISGVQSSLNMTMDTAKCLLVVCVPRASHFGLLIILSYVFWVIGWCLFAAYGWTSSRLPAWSPENGTLAGDVATVTSPSAGRPAEEEPAEARPLLGSDSAPPDGHTAPRDGHTAPPDGHTAPPDGHTAPPDGHTAPPDGHTALPDGHTAPPDSHTGPPDGHTAPPDGHTGPPDGHTGPPDGHTGPPDGHTGPPDGHMGPPDRDETAVPLRTTATASADRSDSAADVTPETEQI